MVITNLFESLLLFVGIIFVLFLSFLCGYFHQGWRDNKSSKSKRSTLEKADV